MNSADRPPAVMPAAGHARTAPSQDPVDPAGPPGSVTGPVAPIAGAPGTHQPLARASLAGGLLCQWQRRNLAASLPLALRQLENAGNLDNVRLAIEAARPAGRRPIGAGPVDPLPGTGYRGPVFMDSDIYKTLEAIGWGPSPWPASARRSRSPRREWP